MASSIIIPGLTLDDKNPGDFHSLRYGVGKKGVNGTVYAIILASKLPDTAASHGTVVQSGAGPAITLSGDAANNTDYVLTISTGGANGTAEFGLTANGIAVASAVTVPTTPFTYDIPSTDITITFADDTWVLSETYTWTSYAPIKNGSANYNQLYDVFDDETGKALAGPGSEGDYMCRAALSVQGVSLKAMFIEEPSGAVAATLNIPINGTWSDDGEGSIRLGKRTFRFTVLSTDDHEDVADRMVSVLNEDERLFCTATKVESSGAYSVRLTVKCLGIRGNNWGAFLDLSDCPTGFVATLSGGTAMTGGGVRFSGGTGTDDTANILAALLPEGSSLYNFYASAPNDAVNAAALRDQMITKAGPLVQKYEQACFGFNGSYANVVTLAQTSLNHPQCQVIFDEEGESHPSEIAALEAATRSVTEGVNPNPNYSRLSTRERRYLAPRAKVAAAIEANHSKRKALLNSGVSPLRTVDNVKIMWRAITTKCLTNAAPDYSTLDVGEATVPMRMAKQVSAAWSAYAEANPYSGPDPDIEGGETPAPEGVGTPNGWKAQILGELRAAARLNWIHRVDDNLPTAEWDEDAERIMSTTPVEVRPLNLQLGNEVRQVA